MAEQKTHITAIESSTPDASVLTQRRVLTGMRTTGELHLGHLVGALENWKAIQDGGLYESFFLLADIQALTTHAGHPEKLTESVRDVILDWLSVGLDPTLDRSHFVLQSQIPERFELSQLLSMITSYSDLMRNPTLKAELEGLKDATVGFMTYPVDQAADIYMVSPTPPKAEDELLVPVGEDQKAHLEFARRIARRANKYGGNKTPILLPCEPLVGRIGRLPGIDGTEKMSKSKGNAIYLSDAPREVESKVMRMFTDPNRKHASDPGETQNNPVFVYLRAFDTDIEEVAELTRLYQKGQIKDVEVKRMLTRVINDMLEPFRERRAKYSNVDIREILEEGTRATRAAAQPVVEALRDRMSLKYP